MFLQLNYSRYDCVSWDFNAAGQLSVHAGSVCSVVTAVRKVGAGANALLCESEGYCNDFVKLLDMRITYMEYCTIFY